MAEGQHTPNAIAQTEVYEEEAVHFNATKALRAVSKSDFAYRSKPHA